MNASETYTCTEYRREMMLLSLLRQLEDPRLPEAEKKGILKQVRELELQLGMK